MSVVCGVPLYSCRDGGTESCTLEREREDSLAVRASCTHAWTIATALLASMQLSAGRPRGTRMHRGKEAP